MSIIPCRHDGNSGDIIHSLCFCKAIAKEHGRKVKLYLGINAPARYGSPHPLGNVQLNREFAEKIIPLVKAQPYIDNCEIWANQEHIEYDLNEFRKVGMDLGRGCITRWYNGRWITPVDMTTPWLTVTPSEDWSNCILVNKTERYSNRQVSYKCITNKKNFVFLGLPSEAAMFRDKYFVKLPNIVANDFLQLAQWIAGCKAFIGCQSFCYAIAMALKKEPRALEVCPSCPNVVDPGPNAYEYWNTKHLQEILERFINK